MRAFAHSATTSVPEFVRLRGRGERVAAEPVFGPLALPTRRLYMSVFICIVLVRSEMGIHIVTTAHPRRSQGQAVSSPAWCVGVLYRIFTFVFTVLFSSRVYTYSCGTALGGSGREPPRVTAARREGANGCRATSAAPSPGSHRRIEIRTPSRPWFWGRTDEKRSQFTRLPGFCALKPKGETESARGGIHISTVCIHLS